MTPLTKPITRRAVIFTDNRIRARACDEVAVTLNPNKTIATIAFRRKGCRKTYTLPLGRVYLLAMQATERAEREAKQAARKQRRSAR